MPLAAEKAGLRQAALAARQNCDPVLGESLAKNVMRQAPPPPGAIIAGFWPLPGEIDILPLLHALAEGGWPLCLPVTPRRGFPLTFRTWKPGDPLTPGRFNTRHPTGPETVPDYILVPLLAFDRAGNRLGYGGGYYDRTLAQLPTAFRLGCAFSAQEMPRIPTGPEDVTLHAIATEKETIRVIARREATKQSSPGPSAA
jgi:5-formyltetrahydrofolate cyclo-ligase